MKKWWLWSQLFTFNNSHVHNDPHPQWFCQNYWRIALSSLFSKVLIHGTLSYQCTVKESNCLWFVYKTGTSPTKCVSVVTEIVNNYLHNESAVYICMIDASKAFDKVNLSVLVSELRQHNMCPRCLRLLL